MKEKVLVAISDLNLAKVLLEQVSKEGFDAYSVVSGSDVIPKMKEVKPDILLIDTMLPDMNGYDVLNEKSLDKDVTKIPVIVISNSGAPIHVNKIPATPMMRDYIVKAHIEPSEVIEKINKVFGKSSNTADSAKQSTGGKKILWVEDDRLLSTILSKKITASGYTLLKANQGDDAFKILEKDTPDLIMLDIMLPGMTGLEVLQKIKMDTKFKNIPVIMLSNTNKQSYIENAKMLGANKFLVKTAVSLDEIIAEVDRLAK
jgi:DNA-binding response OmpR family regulator